MVTKVPGSRIQKCHRDGTGMVTKLLEPKLLETKLLEAKFRATGMVRVVPGWPGWYRDSNRDGLETRAGPRVRSGDNFE